MRAVGGMGQQIAAITPDLASAAAVVLVLVLVLVINLLLLHGLVRFPASLNVSSSSFSSLLSGC